MRIAKVGLDFFIDCFKNALPRTPVDATPGSSLLGLTTTVGAVLLGNAASGNVKADVVGWRWRLPADWRQDGSIVLIATAKVATTLSTLANTVGITATRGDRAGSVGSNVVVAAAKQVTIAYADYSFLIPSGTFKPGDMIYGTLTLTADDTGGAVGTAMSCAALHMDYAAHS